MTESLKARVLPVTPYQQNCSLVWCTKSMRGAIIDPGGELARLKEAVAAAGVRLEKVLLTHGHLDHASGATRLAREFGIGIEGPHEDDLYLLENLGRNALRPGFSDAENVMPDRWLEDGDEVRFGDVTLGVRHCPGHTPGHVVFFHPAERSITRRLWPLGDDMHFVPGHGEMSTFGWERKCNPFVSDLALGRAWAPEGPQAV